jgi:hypothetical protein
VPQGASVCLRNLVQHKRRGLPGERKVVMKKRFDPHAVAKRIMPKLASLKLVFQNGRWYRDFVHDWNVYHARDFEALISRLVRVELDAMDDRERPVTSALTREVILALASLYSSDATRIVKGA